MRKREKPYILAPAGDKNSFLAALAAGADAVYCGLKIFSARMEAENFSIEQLERLAALAASKHVKVYVAFNSMIKQNELDKTARILKKLSLYVKPHALIVQDMGVVLLARKAGFKGEIHLSTLGNGCFAKGLDSIKKAGFSRAVLPRELSVDEIKAMAEKTPEGLELEVFIHGALCYGISGRCYWSSWFGGKSGLRGRCVQPCRRIYAQKQNKERFFSCIDLSVDVLVKVLKTIPEVAVWKIEGRKKSPHYVFYTVKAYKYLRDHGHEPGKKKTALAFLDYALGRPGTHYNFLSQRPQNPLKKDMETGSGLFAGRVKIGPKPFFITRQALFCNDLLRIGYEDDKGHAIQRVTMPVPKKGRLVLKQGKKGRLQKGAPVFIVDRREEDVALLIKKLSMELEKIETHKVMPPDPGFNCQVQVEQKKQKKQKRIKSPGKTNLAGTIEITLRRNLSKTGYPGQKGLWVSSGSRHLQKMGAKFMKDIWWWLPPVIWPGKNEQAYSEAVSKILSKGGRYFVLNIPWQMSLFNEIKSMRGLELWAGPFCNIANCAALTVLKNTGFTGAIVSPELDRETFLSLPEKSPLPLGAVVEGNWPLSISRTISEDIRLDQAFLSPMGENCWVSKKDGNYWVFPGWRLDLQSQKKEMKRAGYSHFIRMEEKLPKGVTMKKRPGLWNWKLRLL